MAKYKSDFLNILDQRGFIHQCSDFNGLDKKLAEGPQSAYVGYDATAKSLHVGNLMSIMMLHWFQQTGHRPITLMGGGTSKVGDPSGKDEGRKLLTEKDIQSNINSIKGVFSKFLKYGLQKADAMMINNDEWLKDINYIEFLRDYGRHFTINRMMTFDSVKLRLEREQPMTFLEFNYMILQAYDFVKLRENHNVVLQMGGSDQWGNIINGVDLWRRIKGADSGEIGIAEVGKMKIGKDFTDPIFALTCPLLTTSSGAKMGKTADGAVWLNADMCSPYDYYQYWRNTEDPDVGRFLKIFTTLPMDEITKLEKLKDAEINEAKKTLAFEATKLCHGEKAAQGASSTAQKVFEQGGVGGDLPTIEIDKPAALVVDLLLASNLAESKSAAKRLIEGGGARINDLPVTTIDQSTSASDFASGYIKLSAGKKKHALVKLK